MGILLLNCKLLLACAVSHCKQLCEATMCTVTSEVSVDALADSESMKAPTQTKNTACET